MKRIKRKKKAGIDPITRAFERMKVTCRLKVPQFILVKYFDRTNSKIHGWLAESEKSTNTIEGICQC